MPTLCEMGTVLQTYHLSTQNLNITLNRSVPRGETEPVTKKIPNRETDSETLLVNIIRHSLWTKANPKELLGHFSPTAMMEPVVRSTTDIRVQLPRQLSKMKKQTQTHVPSAATSPSAWLWDSTTKKAFSMCSPLTLQTH